MAGKNLIRDYRLEDAKQTVGVNSASAYASGLRGSAAASDGEAATDDQAGKMARLQNAQQTVEAAQKEAEEIRQRAQEEGYRRGYEEGRSAGEQAGESVIAGEVQRIREVAESAQVGRLRLLASLEGEMVELVLAVARKVIGDELSQNPDTIVNIVRQAAAQISNARPLRVRLHPHDAERLAGYWSREGHPNGDEQKWELVSDERVSLGGCIIEAGAGTVDARIETQMSEIANAFRETAGIG